MSKPQRHCWVEWTHISGMPLRVTSDAKIAADWKKQGMDVTLVVETGEQPNVPTD